MFLPLKNSNIIRYKEFLYLEKNLLPANCSYTSKSQVNYNYPESLAFIQYQLQKQGGILYAGFNLP